MSNSAHTQSDAAAPSDDNGLGAVVLHHTVTALMVALILALGVWAYLSFRDTAFFKPAAGRQGQINAYIVDAQQQRLRFGLDVYERLNGRYPPALNNLVEPGLLLPDDLYYPAGGHTYQYTRSGSDYVLRAVPTTAPTADAPID